MLRILLMSDLHFCGDDSYGYTVDERFEMLINDIQKENELCKLDMILLLGDYALDFWIYKGSYVEHKISNTARFFECFHKELPCPAYSIPGNHEQYGNRLWKEITGFERQLCVTLGDYVFVMLDNFGLDLDPDIHSDGTYSYVDVEYIKKQLEHFPDKKFFLCAHDFYYKREREEFKSLVKNTDRILALFAGHTHSKEAICLGAEYGNKFLFRTGQYVYLPNATKEHLKWGFRDLKIDENSFSTEFICAR